MKNVYFQQKIQIFTTAAVGGITEAEGKIGGCLDYVGNDDLFGAETWEIAESRMVKKCAEIAFAKSKTAASGVDFLLGGDLLNQCTASSFGVLPFQIPYLGLYGACSTFAEGLFIAASLLQLPDLASGGVIASSHFSTAERQYRFPLEYGAQRTPTAQRTVTGCGCALLQKRDQDTSMPLITAGRIGIICDAGVKDANNMGAAMAPAAADTLCSFLKEAGEDACDYDMILTGDLGNVGAMLFRELCAQSGILLGAEYFDCGNEIYHTQQDVHAGASGCGCSAIYLCAALEKMWKTKPLHRVLFIGTGALLSPVTVQQKLSIPAIAHLIRIEKE